MSNHPRTSNNAGAYLPFLYLTAVWLTAEFNLPLGPFDGVPFFVVLTFIMLALFRFEVKIYFVAISLVLVSYELLKSTQIDFRFTTKGFVGLIAFSAIITANYFSMLFISRCTDEQIGRWLRYLLFMILFALLLDLAVLSPIGLATSPYGHYFLPIRRFSGLYGEPSHLALALSPFVFLITFRYRLCLKHLGKGGVFSFFAISALCPSATLFAIVGIAILLRIVELLVKGQITLFIVAAPILLGITFAIFQIPEMLVRVEGVASSQSVTYLFERQNLSALVFRKGLQMTEYAMLHFPLGVAFLNMETLVHASSISRLSDSLYYLNSKDGASILFKGISEFGYVFIFFVFASIYRFVKHLSLIQTYSLFQSVVVAFEFTFFCYFLRGGNYFSGAISITLSILVFGLLPSTKVDLWRRKFENRLKVA